MTKKRKNRLFSNITEERLDEIINEEMGIASEVEKTSDAIYNFIKLGITEFPLNNNFKVVYSENVPYNGFSKEENTLYLKNDKSNSDTDLKNAIYHEVEHMWQIINKNGPLSNNIYQTATLGAIHETGDYQAICQAYYFSRRFEIDAFCNGIYGEERESPFYGSYEEFISQTNFKGLFKKYQELLDYFSNNKLDDNLFAKSWKLFLFRTKQDANKGPKQIIKWLESGYDYLKRKSARIYNLVISGNKKSWNELTLMEQWFYKRIKAEQRHDGDF